MQATDDRAAMLADSRIHSIPLPDHTSVSLSLDEVTRLRAGFIRSTDADEALYNRLLKAETRLIIRSATDVMTSAEAFRATVGKASQ